MKASDRTRLELELLNNLPDSEIDTSDIPERDDWTGSTRSRFYRPAKEGGNELIGSGDRNP
jgi:hypothetical protein